MNALTFLAADIANNQDEVTHALYDREYFGYVSVVLSYLSGIALTCLLIIVPIMMIVDVVYLLLPSAKTFYDEWVARHDDAGGRLVKRLLVSKNAIEAFEDAANANSPVMWCYLKRSIKFYAIVVCVIFILVAGIDVILLFIYKLFGGLIEWFKNL